MSVNKYEQELKTSGSMLYTWQYDLHWAAQQLRNEKKLKPVHKRRDLPVGTGLILNSKIGLQLSKWRWRTVAVFINFGNVIYLADKTMVTVAV